MPQGRILAGIDIGSSKIATVIAQAIPDTGERSLRILGVSWAPSSGVRKGQIVDIEETSTVLLQAVERAERMAGFTIDRVVIVINGGHVGCQNSHGVVAVSSPDGEIGREDVDRAVGAAQAISLPASREIIHVLPSEFIVDQESGVKDPVGMAGVRLEVETHLVTASSTALKNLTKCVEEVGANVAGVIFSGLAASIAVLTETEKELGVVLIDFGGGTTSLAVFIEGALVHSRVLPIGAKNITNDIAIGLRTSLESAEKIKISLSETSPKRGGKESPGKEDEIDLGDVGEGGEERRISRKTLVDGIIRPRLNEIFSMVGMELKSAGLGGRTPAGVVLTGGGALTAGAQESARRMLALPVRLGVPISNSDGPEVTGIVEDVSSPSFAGTVGAVLWAAQTGTHSSSFYLGAISRTFEKIPMKGIFGRVVEVVKGLLP